jgi:ATP phosphoribosyltransferase regulatory subunit
MTLYPDAVLRAAPALLRRPRCFLPLGTSGAVGEALRDAGFATVAALSAADAPGPLHCTHEWDGAQAAPLLKEG